MLGRIATIMEGLLYRPFRDLVIRAAERADDMPPRRGIRSRTDAWLAVSAT